MTESHRVLHDSDGDDPREGVEVPEWEPDVESEVKKKLNDVLVYVFTDGTFEDGVVESEVVYPLDEMA